MIDEETRGELTSQSRRGRRPGDAGAVPATATRSRPCTPPCGDEFRVRIAQLALTGTAAGVGRHTLTAPPTELTPQESWTLFQDARTTVRVGLIDVPVKDFLAQVTATPSEGRTEEAVREVQERRAGPGPRTARVPRAAEDPGGVGRRRTPTCRTTRRSPTRSWPSAPALRLLGDTVAASDGAHAGAARRRGVRPGRGVPEEASRLVGAALDLPAAVARVEPGPAGDGGGPGRRHARQRPGPVAAAVAGPLAMPKPRPSVARPRSGEVRRRDDRPAANPSSRSACSLPRSRPCRKTTFGQARPQLLAQGQGRTDQRRPGSGRPIRRPAWSPATSTPSAAR